MTAQKLDGKAASAAIKDELRARVAALAEKGVVPGIATVLVGADPASQLYVGMKHRASEAIGMNSIQRELPADATQTDVEALIDELNADPSCHGYIVQLPLPKHINEATVLEAILVEKDADGFSADNIGNMCLKGGKPPLALPCTPAGCIELLKRSKIEISGKDCVVIGRSNIVGMPVAHLLQSMNGTVTVCHSRTKDLAGHVRRADIVVAAIGSAEMILGEWIKPGAVVIDVGMNSKPAPETAKGYKLCGDVDFESAKQHASAITPVPGGVGPMTIAMLLKNTLNLARHATGLPSLHTW